MKPNERGAVIIQVAACLLALTAFSAIVIDYGVLWVARAQAQNAADAGALAGAIALLNNPLELADARLAASGMAGVTRVWGEATAAADVLVNLPIPCPPGTGGGAGCVQVDVLRGSRDRNGRSHSNVLPVMFAQLVGAQSQGILATATAQVSAANAVSCIKPWIIPDRWTDNDEAPLGTWTPDKSFSPPMDTYTRGGGFTFPDDIGQQLLLKGDANAWSAGWVQEITWTDNNSAADYLTEIERCPTWVPVVKIYDGSVPCLVRNDANPAEGCIKVKPGGSNGPTQKGVQALVDLDPYATWNPSTNTVDSPCMTAGTCRNYDGNDVDLSARIVPIAVFNPQAYWDQSCSGQNCVTQVTNIFGFFVEGMCDDVYPSPATRPAFCGTTPEAKKTVLGRIMIYPGLGLGGDITASSFTKLVRLVR